MTRYSCAAIGRAVCADGGYVLQVDRAYRDGLIGLEAFRWILVQWFAHKADCVDGPALVVARPYRDGPERLGVFATRSPVRPNPLCISVAAVTGIDVAAGEIHLGWIDCDDGTPILDIKPYQASIDRVEEPHPPRWCARWPASVETSGDFDWSSVFAF